MSIFTTLKKYRNELDRNNNKLGLTMQLRLFVFLLLFLLIVMLSVLIILMSTGILKAGEKEIKTLLENELTHITNDIYNDFGNISLQGIELSKSLSCSMEKTMKELDVNVKNFSTYPDCLEVILNEEMQRLTNALERTKSSGAFIILDATINPTLENSEYSKAGIYVKNMEPNIVNNISSNFRFLRGPMSVAFQNNIYILPQWKMEFNLSEASYFTTVLNKSKNSDIPLSRMYLWTDSINLTGNDEDIMLCIVPLISNDNTVFGLCGFEISSMLFKLSYSPDNSKFSYLFSMLSKYENEQIHIDNSLFAGSYSAYPYDKENQTLSITTNSKFLNIYQQNIGNKKYVGLHKEISLYPNDSLYKNDRRIISVLMPEDEISSVLSKQNTALIICFSILILLSIIACMIISKLYMKPIITAFELIKTVNPSDVPKTKIIEIDDLLEFLSTQDENNNTVTEKSYSNEDKEISSKLYMEFIKNIDSLSTAERAVFNLYLKGHTAKEIADILCLSINTIKTHNKRIYMKLNVSSRKELMLYIRMMEESNNPLVAETNQQV